MPEIVKRALDATSGLSLRGAGKALGVSYTLVGEWRKARKKGDPISPHPEVLRRLEQTVLQVEAETRPSLDIERIVKRLAARRLRAMADELEAEATSAGSVPVEEAAESIPPESGEDRGRRQA